MHKYTGRTEGGTLMTIETAKPMKKTELRFIFHWYKEEMQNEITKPNRALEGKEE